MIKAVIFDADCTLIDSMYFWHNSLNDYLVGKGIDVSNFPINEIEELNIKDASDFVINYYNLNVTPEEITGVIKRNVGEFFSKKVELKKGVAEFLEILKKKNIKMIVATGTDTPLINIALKKCGIYDYFADVICCKDVGARKTDPAIYRAALEKLGTTREDTLVFEDALYCLRTAKADGFKVVGVYDSEEKSTEEMKAEADYFTTDYSEGEKILDLFA